MLPINQLLLKVLRQKWLLGANLAIISGAIAFSLLSIVTITLLKQQKPTTKTTEIQHQETVKNNPIVRKNLTQNQLKEIAKLITVRIFAKIEELDIGGSGVLIREKNNYYLVLTNNHVIAKENINYQIQSPTGKIYKGEIIWQNKSSEKVEDMALICFFSSEKYQIGMINNSHNLKINELVIASGFPFQDNLEQSKNIKHTIGVLSEILPKPLMGGYQIGYTNNIHSGMSGGSILNLKGQLIGINGLGKYPALGNPYVYQNGENIPENNREMMINLSWGISSQTINKIINQLEAKNHINCEKK